MRFYKFCDSQGGELLDAEPYAKQQVYLRLDVLNCCVMFVTHTNDVTGPLNLLPIMTPPTLRCDFPRGLLICK